MTAEIMINKVVITEEAKFDYEEVVGCMTLPKTAIKNECENYIDNMQKGGRLLYDYYFRVKYLDENSDKMLMLFFYKGEKFGKMQMWKLSGICEADDWSEELEYDGNIRNWLKESITDYKKEDWVLDLREAERRGNIGKLSFFKLAGLSKEVMDAIYSGTDKDVFERLSHLQRKGGKWVGYKGIVPKHRAARKVRKRT